MSRHKIFLLLLLIGYTSTSMPVSFPISSWFNTLKSTAISTIDSCWSRTKTSFPYVLAGVTGLSMYLHYNANSKINALGTLKETLEDSTSKEQLDNDNVVWCLSDGTDAKDQKISEYVNEYNQLLQGNDDPSGVTKSRAMTAKTQLSKNIDLVLEGSSTSTRNRYGLHSYKNFLRNCIAIELAALSAAAYFYYNR